MTGLSKTQIKQAIKHLPPIFTTQDLADYFEYVGNGYDGFKHHLQKAKQAGWVKIHQKRDGRNIWKNLLNPMDEGIEAMFD